MHGTCRDPSAGPALEHLRALPGAGERLKLFAADLLTEGSFDTAVQVGRARALGREENAERRVWVAKVYKERGGWNVLELQTARSDALGEPALSLPCTGPGSVLKGPASICALNKWPVKALATHYSPATQSSSGPVAAPAGLRLRDPHRLAVRQRRARGPGAGGADRAGSQGHGERAGWVVDCGLLVGLGS